MKSIAIYTLTSALHDADSVKKATQDFLGGLNIEYDFRDSDFSDYGSHALDLIYVRTGGTEGLFRKLLPQLKGPFFLLTSGKSNSLAASMEILAYLNQQHLRGEIIHGSNAYVSHRIEVLRKVGEARRRLQGLRLGVIGQPSDWLIASNADYRMVKERLGIEIVDIRMDKLLQLLRQTSVDTDEAIDAPLHIRQAYPGAKHIYKALNKLTQLYGLNGFTIRCFDLLSTEHNTGCWALARLNADGIVAGCEGDVPALLSMTIANAITGQSGFQANPASINPETGEMLFAHCTIPFNMVNHYELDTHFESGIGIGIRGYMQPGPVTIVKVAGDLSRHFLAEGELLHSSSQPNLCRTQQTIQLTDKQQTRYFLTNPIGNHHIIVQGHCRELFEELLSF